jgi:hypothetical protein
MQALLFAAAGEERVPMPVPVPATSPPADALIQTIASAVPANIPDAPVLTPEAQAAVVAAVIAEIAAEGVAQGQAAVYQDFQLRCRMRGVAATLDLAGFNRQLAMALAGVDDGAEWSDLMMLAAALPEEMLAPFLALARAARDGAECPTDTALAALYRTASAGRVRRMLEHIEQKGLIVCRADLSGRRAVSFPHFGWITAAAQPDPARPPRMARIMARERAAGR